MIVEKFIFLKWVAHTIVFREEILCKEIMWHTLVGSQNRAKENWKEVVIGAGGICISENWMGWMKELKQVGVPSLGIWKEGSTWSVGLEEF